MITIDINCDMGETPGDKPGSTDTALLPLISSANIACGFHAGDPKRMAQTIEAALRRGVAIGAHPGFLDKEDFGRLEKPIMPDEVYELTLYQIGALYGFVRAAGGRLHHVKAHGALYNMAARDRQLADALVTAVHDFDPELVLYALAGSEMIEAAHEKGLRVAAEGFVDRNYMPDGRLVPRSHPAALITDIATAVRQSVWLSERVDTICVHGDTPDAVEMARAVYEAFTRSGITICPPTL